MFSLRARIAAYSGLAFAGLVLVLLVTRPAADPLDDPAYDALSKALSRRIAAESLAASEARARVVHDTVRVATAITRYETIRDSVFIPTTRAETVAVLDRLPRLLRSADSLKATCTDLKHDTAPLLTTCEAEKADLRLDRDRWKLEAESRKPSRWDGLKAWGLRLSIGYVAFKIGQAAR